MKKNGRVAGMVLLLALYAATTGPARAGGWQGRDEAGGGQGFWAVLWQRAVCWVDDGCGEATKAQAQSPGGSGPRAIFASEGHCIDPNGRPGAAVCYQVQAPSAP